MKASVFDGILIHYGELALKGDNRSYFEDALFRGIREHLKGLPFKEIKRLYGRFFVEAEITEINKADYKQALLHIFGIANFSFAKKIKSPRSHGQFHGTVEGTVEDTIEEIKKAVVDLLKIRMPASFKIETIRSDKRFPQTSLEVSKGVGANVVRELGLRVDVVNPEVTCFVEITAQGIFIYLDKIQGLRGLPTDTGRTVLGFLSGGIDSPAACYKIMSRGVRVIFTHFHSYPQTSRASMDKVKDLASTLDKYQLNSKLYLVPFLDIQKQILMNCEPETRVLLYRRMMMRIGNIIAGKEGAQALVTGESLGQVASQTITNLAVIEKVSIIPVLRPLVGSDKNEIIELARKIETYEISIRPYDDCCQVFLPPHPATYARLEDIEREEGRLEFDRLVKEAIEKSEVINL